eukprot:UN02546
MKVKNVGLKLVQFGDKILILMKKKKIQISFLKIHYMILTILLHNLNSTNHFQNLYHLLVLQKFLNVFGLKHQIFKKNKMSMSTNNNNNNHVSAFIPLKLNHQPFLKTTKIQSLQTL